MKKPLVIYHGNCADGFGAAWCFWNKYRDAVDYYPGVYQEPPPDVEGRQVYLVDFSYKRSVLLQMATKAEHITVIDHHKSAIEDLRNIQQDAAEGDYCSIGTYFDLNRSGAVLAWKYLYGSRPEPNLLLHIEDRDLWRFLLPHTREIQAALFSYPYDFETWDELIWNTDIRELVSAGSAIERKHHKDIVELLAVCRRRMVIAGHDVPVASLPYTLSSDAGHAMAQGEPFAACYYDTETKRCFSLRSSEAGLDVSEIAKVYGGGGHKHAAGFAVPRDHVLATI